MKILRSLLLLGLLSIGLVACDGNRVYQQAYDFEDSGWHLDTIPAFEFQIEDRQPKNLILSLRNSISYPYRNIYLTYYLEDSLGNELASELVNLPLFDEKTGKPFGSGSSIYQHTVGVLNGFSFPGTGRYTFKVAQYMREIELKEVESVGFRVEEAEK